MKGSLDQAEAPDASQVAAKVADNVGQAVENVDQEVRGAAASVVAGSRYGRVSRP